MAQRRRVLRSIGGERRGGVATETALVLPLIAGLIFAVADVGLMLFSNSVVENAARSAARQVRTGQVQGSANAMTAFQTRLCSELSSVIDCGQLSYDVRSFASFGAVVLPPPAFNAQGQMTGTAFAPGAAGQVVAVRVTYPYKFHAPFLGSLLGGMSPTTQLLMSTVVFRNEPFGT